MSVGLKYMINRELIDSEGIEGLCDNNVGWLVVLGLTAL